MPRDISPAELEGSIDKIRRHLATALLCRRLLGQLGQKIGEPEMRALRRDLDAYAATLRHENSEFRDLPAPVLTLLDCGTLGIRFADEEGDDE
jgi:hypothetical protein